MLETRIWCISANVVLVITVTTSNTFLSWLPFTDSQTRFLMFWLPVFFSWSHLTSQCRSLGHPKLQQNRFYNQENPYYYTKCTTSMLYLWTKNIGKFAIRFLSEIPLGLKNTLSPWCWHQFVNILGWPRVGCKKLFANRFRVIRCKKWNCDG